MRFYYQFKICVIRRCFAALVSIVVDELDFCFQFEERERDLLIHRKLIRALFFSFRYDRFWRMHPFSRPIFDYPIIVIIAVSIRIRIC